MSDGYSILITRPKDLEPFQETWLAHLANQADAVKAVQNAAAELNDSKVEILNGLSHAELMKLGVAEGRVQRQGTFTRAFDAGREPSTTADCRASDITAQSDPERCSDDDRIRLPTASGVLPRAV